MATAKDGPFKINKLNLIWTKAQHSLGPNKLKDLKADLLKHEPDELRVKTMKANQQDKGDLVEASVKRKLQSIMEKYALERYYDDIHLRPSNKGKQLPVEMTSFRDSKLDKLWKKAQKAGFSPEELMLLHEEFEKHETKVVDHYKFAHNLDETLEKAERELQRLENSIEVESLSQEDSRGRKSKKPSKDIRETPAEKKARLEANAQQILREKHGEIKRDYNQLHQKINSGTIDIKKPFKEARVNALWDMATKSNFTEEELTLIKDELEHYQGRIEKLKHLQNQLQRHEIGSKDYRTNADEDEDIKHLKKRVKELTLKVEKADQSIVNKFVKEEL